jgi:amidase
MFTRHELMLSPVLAHVTPRIGYLSPNVSFDVLIERLRAYVAYPPLNNIAGSPAISLPLGQTDDGRPIGVHLGAAHGDERTLLEVAFALEAERPWPRIKGCTIGSGRADRRRDAQHGGVGPAGSDHLQAHG